MGYMRLLVLCAVVVYAHAESQGQCSPPPRPCGGGRPGGNNQQPGNYGPGGGNGGQMGGRGQGGQGRGDNGDDWDDDDDDWSDGGKAECDCKECAKQNLAALKCLPHFPDPDPCKLMNTTSEQSVMLKECGDWSTCTVGPATSYDIALYYCTPDCPRLRKKAKIIAPYAKKAMLLDPVALYPKELVNMWDAGTKAWVRGRNDFLNHVFKMHLKACMLTEEDLGMPEDD